MKLSSLIGKVPMDAETMKALVDFDVAQRKQRKDIHDKAFALFPDLDKEAPFYAAYLHTLALNDFREYGDDPTIPYITCFTLTIG